MLPFGSNDLQVKPTWISDRWWWVFSVEPFFCLFMVLYMGFLPKEYCYDLIGSSVHYPKVLPLVWQHIGVIFSMYVVTLGQLLLGTCSDVQERIRCFRYIQVGMGIGDMILIGVAIYFGFANSMAVVTLSMSLLRGGIRLFYLRDTNRHPT